jgi:signal transduction histidine kinase
MNIRRLGFARGLRQLVSALTLSKSRLPLPRGVSAGMATVFFVLAVTTAVDLTRDFTRQKELQQAESQKRQLALLGEVELGHAVQDFKDCLLRDDTSCGDFDRHIQAVAQTVAQYAAQTPQQPDERTVVAALGQALSIYRSALYEVRGMQRQHASIREIDNVVKGEDRPVAAGLSALVARSSSRHTGWRVPIDQAFWLLGYTTLAILLLYLTFPSVIRLGRHSGETAQALRQLSNRMIEWDEDKKAKAFVRLHDGICQSLTGIMYFLESAQPVTAGGVPEPVLPSLQAAIQDARAVAMQLRPPRMQEAGLLATLHSLWIDSRALNAALVIKPRILVEESDIPAALKPVILRIAQMAVELAEQSPSARPLGWLLDRTGQALRLSIDTAVDAGESQRTRPSASRAALNPLDAIQARVVLSGGSSDCVRNFSGGTKIVCTWSLDDPTQD